MGDYHGLQSPEVLALHNPAASGPFPLSDEDAVEGMAGRRLIGRFDHSRPGQRRAGYEGNDPLQVRLGPEQRPSLRHRRRRFSHEDARVGTARNEDAGGGGRRSRDRERCEKDEPRDHDVKGRITRLRRGVNWTLVGWTLVVTQCRVDAPRAVWYLRDRR